MATFFPTNWSIQLASCPYFMGKCRRKHGLGRFLWHSFLFLSFFLLPEDVETSFDILLIFVLKIFPQALLIRPIENFSLYYKMYFQLP